MRIDQIMAGYADGDAISNMAVQMRDIFRGWGYESDIFAAAATVSASLRDDSKGLEEYRGGAGDIAFHHYGIMSDAAEAWAKCPARKVMVYHNITPPEWFEGFDDSVASRLRHALEELPQMAKSAEEVWTVSKFNAEELVRMEIPEVKLLPLPFTAPPKTIDEQSLPYNDPLTNILFVGRIAPNKRIEDLIEAFAWYHQGVNRQSRLFIVGSVMSCPRYYSMLRMLVGDLGLENVCFEGFVSNENLPGYYKLADVYVSPSQHEGYCLPLVEAMYHRVPVVARETGGTPEAMDGAGVLYNDLSNAELGALIGRVVEDRALIREILAAQQKRVARALERDLANELANLLQGVRRAKTEK